MSGRLYAALSVLAVTGLSALSLGGPLFYFFSWTILLMILYGLLSVLLGRGLTVLIQGTDCLKADRGGTGTLTVGLKTKCPLPLGPVALSLSLPEGKSRVLMRAGIRREREASFVLRFPHVGVWRCGADALVFTDVFGATPCNVAQKLVDGGHTRLIAGVNLPMLLRAMTYRREPIEALVARAMAGGVQGVMQVATAAPQNQARKKHDQNPGDHQQ